jgi:replicative superfamily II helicase
MAQSTLNETSEPALFVCPNKQLVTQTVDRASEYSIPAVPYEKPFREEFRNGKSVMVATYPKNLKVIATPAKTWY